MDQVRFTDPETTVSALFFALKIAFSAPGVWSNQMANSPVAIPASAGAEWIRVMKPPFLLNRE